MPTCSIARKQPTDGAVAEIEQHENDDGEEGEPFPDMVKDVMAHFVAEHGKDASCGFFSQTGVPDDHAFGGTDAGDVGVGVDGFVASEHPEHAFGGSGHATAFGDLLKLGNQFRRLRGKRLELVEHGVNDYGLQEEDEERDRDGDRPEIEPPAVRATANHCEQNPGKEAADDHHEELSFEPIAGPGTPTLDGDSVVFHERFTEEIERKLEEAERERKQRRIDERLQEANARRGLGPIAELCGKLGLKNQPKREEGVEETEQPKGEANGAESFGLGVEGRGKRVLGDFPW